MMMMIYDDEYDDGVCVVWVCVCVGGWVWMDGWVCVCVCVCVYDDDGYMNDDGWMVCVWMDE